MTNFGLSPAVNQVILRLDGTAKRKMIECIRSELDPDAGFGNITREFRLERTGPVYTSIMMSNGWAPAFRDITERIMGFPAGETQIFIVDLLSFESVLDSGIGVM